MELKFGPAHCINFWGLQRREEFNNVINFKQKGDREQISELREYFHSKSAYTLLRTHIHFLWYCETKHMKMKSRELCSLFRISELPSTLLWCTANAPQSRMIDVYTNVKQNYSLLRGGGEWKYRKFSCFPETIFGSYGLISFISLSSDKVLIERQNAAAAPCVVFESSPCMRSNIERTKESLKVDETAEIDEFSKNKRWLPRIFIFNKSSNSIQQSLNETQTDGEVWSEKEVREIYKHQK